MNLKISDALGKEMKALGISVAGSNGSDLKFKCKLCGEGWSVKWDGDDEALRGWWRCPGGCNADITRASKADFRELWGEVERNRK